MDPALSPRALALVLFSALLHATWNALLKGGTDKAATALLLSAMSVFVGLGIGWWVDGFVLPPGGVPWLVLCSFIEAAYFVTLAGAMSRLSLGTAYGLSRGLGLLLVWPLSALVFGEGATETDIGGVVLLTAGLLALAREAPSGSGLRWAIACALTIATYPIAYKRALAEGADPYALFAGAIGLSVPVQLVALGPQRLERLRATLRVDASRIVVGGTVCTASFLIFLVVLRDEGAGRVTALRNASVLFAALFSRLRGEDGSWRAACSAAAVALGCALVA